MDTRLTAGAQPGDRGAPEITIVLADDHAVVRNGLRLLLEAEEDMEVVAEAGDVEAAQRFVLGHKPTVLVLDLNMPGGSSLEAIPRVAEVSPDTTVVVLTMQEDPAFAREALRAGARGYVLKHAAGNELVQAIRAAARGGRGSTPISGRGWPLPRSATSSLSSPWGTSTARSRIGWCSAFAPSRRTAPA